MNKDGPVSRHFNNADNIGFGADENTFLYPIEQIRVMPKELNLLNSKENFIGLKL